MRYFSSICITLFIFLFITVAIATAQNRREFISSNKMTKAIVYNYSEKGVILESRISILNRKGKVQSDTSFTSKDHEHGLGVIQAEWTANSQFLVFGMQSSGGHQPWHVFTFVYSTNINKLISIDKVVEPVTSKFKLFPPDSIEAVGFKTNINHSMKFGLRLSNLINHKNR